MIGLGLKQSVKEFVSEELLVNKEYYNRVRLLQFLHKQVYVLVFKNNAYPNDSEKDFLLASYSGNIDMIKKYLNQNIHFDCKDQNGSTPLILASSQNHIELVKVLAEAGANLDVQNNDGITALMLSAQFGFFEISKYLIEIGANTQLKSNNGQIAFELASLQRHNEIAGLLLDDIKSRLHQNMPILSYYENTDITKLPKMSQSARQIISDHFKSLKGELPIYGGWGYTKEEAVVIDKNDSTVTPGMPFDGVGIQYIFVEKRIYEELIIFRSKNDKYAGIRWNLVKQSVISDDGKDYDHLIFNVTAFKDSDWDELKNEWESNNGFYNNPEKQKIHEQKRDSKMIKYTTDYWFDITSFYRNR